MLSDHHCHQLLDLRSRWEEKQTLMWEDCDQNVSSLASCSTSWLTFFSPLKVNLSWITFSSLFFFLFLYFFVRFRYICTYCMSVWVYVRRRGRIAEIRDEVYELDNAGLGFVTSSVPYVARDNMWGIFCKWHLFFSKYSLFRKEKDVVMLQYCHICVSLLSKIGKITSFGFGCFSRWWVKRLWQQHFRVIKEQIRDHMLIQDTSLTPSYPSSQWWGLLSEVWAGWSPSL